MPVACRFSSLQHDYPAEYVVPMAEALWQAVAESWLDLEAQVCWSVTDSPKQAYVPTIRLQPLLWPWFFLIHFRSTQVRLAESLTNMLRSNKRTLWKARVVLPWRPLFSVFQRLHGLPLPKFEGTASVVG